MNEVFNLISFGLAGCFLGAGVIGFFISDKYHILFLYLCIGLLFLISVIISDKVEGKK